jgi:hypothetical protein
MAYPDGFGNMLSGSMTSVWATIWLTDGIGWLLVSRHATNPSRFVRVGIAASAAGVLWLIAGCLFKYVAWEISYTMLAVSWVLILASILRYFIWSENWQPVRRIISNLGDTGIRYDVPEVIILAILWLISLSSLGKGVFVGASLIFWNIAGGVSSIRMFDLPAAVGIGATPIARLVFLWLARISLIVAIMLKLII